MWLSRPRRLLPQLDDVIEILEGLGTMLMQIDAKLERVLSTREEEDE